MDKRIMGRKLRKYAKLDDDIKRLQAERDKLNADIKAAMAAEGLGVVTAGGYAAIVTRKAGAVRIDGKALKRDLPEVAARYSYQGAPTASLSVKAVAIEEE